MIELDSTTMLYADFAAATVLVSFCVLLGKVKEIDERLMLSLMLSNVENVGLVKRFRSKTNRIYTKYLSLMFSHL